MAKHHLSHKEEVKGGKHSHEHHKEMAHHHHKEMKKHVDHLAKMAKAGHKHHESKKEAHEHEHRGMERHERGPVRHHHARGR